MTLGVAARTFRLEQAAAASFSLCDVSDHLH